MDSLVPFIPEKFHETEFVILDFETTGLNPREGDAIIEIAGIKTRGKEKIGKFEQLVNPGRSIHPEAEKISGITNAHVAMFGKPLAKAIVEFKVFLDGAVLVGHNIRRFDAEFLHQHYADHGLAPLENPIMDTLELARASLNIGRYNLATLAQYFNIEQSRAHRAMSDTQTTMEVLWRLLELRGIV